MIKKEKNTMPWTYAFNDLHGEKVFGMFYETNCKEQIKKYLESKKQSGEKVINYIVNGKVMIVHLIAG